MEKADSSLPPVLGHYRQAVAAPGATLHVAGQVPVDETGTTVGIGDAVQQAGRVATNLAAVLAAHDRLPRHVVALRVYVTSEAAAKAWAEVRQTLFVTDPPASTLVYVVRLAHRDWELEVEAVASLT